MRTLIFALLLMAGNLFAQPTPREWINPFTTNRPPQPVFGDNNISISNRLAGSSGSNWDFFGIGPNTVARLLDISNIVNNANYVLIKNGGSSNQLATNLTAVYSILANAPDDGTSTNLVLQGPVRTSGGTFLSVKNGPSEILNVSSDGGLLIGPSSRFEWGGPALNGNILIAYRDNTRGDADSFRMLVEQDDGTNFGEWSLSGNSLTCLESILSHSGDNSYEVLLDSSALFGRAQLVINNNLVPQFLARSDGYVTNSGDWDIGGDATIYGSLSALSGIGITGGGTVSGALKFTDLSASRLAAFSATSTLTNSIYSEQTLADLQAATNSLQAQLTAATNALNVASNALRTAVGTTNSYALIQSGFLNNVTSTNGQFYSPTNTAQASNQVGLTIKGLTGQATNLLEVFTNTASTKTVIDSQGRIGINTNVPNQALHVNGNLLVSGTGLITNKSMYSSGQTENQGTLSRNTSIGYNSASSMDLADTAGIINFPNCGIWQSGTETNGFGRSRNPNGSILASNLWLLGNQVIIGGFTNKSTIYAPTNTAPVNTIVSGGLHVLTLGKGWTNDLGGRADLVMQVKFTDAATGDPSFAFTNTTSGVSWTNGIAFGIVGTDTRTIVEPDINPSDTGSLTDLSGTGASVTILQAWWKVK